MDSNYRQRSDSSASKRKRGTSSASSNRGSNSSRQAAETDARKRGASGSRAGSSAAESRELKDLRETNDYRVRQRSTGPNQSSQSGASGPMRSTRRQTVDYEQTAASDLQRQELSRDPRMRSARRMRDSDSTRALAEPGAERSDSRSASSRSSTGRGAVGSSGRTGGSTSGRGDRRSADASSEVTGRMVRAERERRQSERPKQALVRSRIYAAVIAVGVLLLAAVAVYFSPAFTITSISVEGVWHLNAEHLTELAQVPSNSTLLRIDTEQVAQRVASDPWVASVKLTRDFPSGLVITIIERQPVALVLLEGSDSSTGRGVWVLASDGVWLGEVIGIDQSIHGLESSQLVRITNLPQTVAAQQGKQATDLSLLNALAIVNGVSSPMKTMIDLISAPSVAATTLYLTNNVEVVFGSAEDVEKKELVINQLIAEHGSTLIRINVRVADRPSIKQSAEPHSD